MQIAKEESMSTTQTSGRAYMRSNPEARVSFKSAKGKIVVRQLTGKRNSHVLAPETFAADYVVGDASAPVTVQKATGHFAPDYVPGSAPGSEVIPPLPVVVTAPPAPKSKRARDAGRPLPEVPGGSAMLVKAINIRYPWVGLIRDGKKTVETRTWVTHYRGPLLLVASKSPVGPHSGHAVALVRLAECRAMLPDDWAKACDQPYDRAMAWVLEDVLPIKPFPVRGKQGFFHVNAPEELAISIIARTLK